MIHDVFDLFSMMEYGEVRGAFFHENTNASTRCFISFYAIITDLQP